MITMLRALMDKVDDMQKQMYDISGEMEIVRIKEMLEIKDTVKEIFLKNALGELISRLDMVEERIFLLEDFSIETQKTKAKKKKDSKKAE